jgi:4-deoxy-L-threo-5-hexosulose-uronate ketol-isomerase
MKVINSVHPKDFKTYSTDLIRERFLLDSLAQPGKINFIYTHYDRMIVGMAIPVNSEIGLPGYDILRADYFLERREMGIINVGGDGTISVNNEKYSLNKLDCLYLGKGTQKVAFSSADADQPAVFYILSAPAHAVYPIKLLKKDHAQGGDMGAVETANKRTIYRYIHKDGLQSCQLVMGLTILTTGSVWNTIPAHIHDRRMEVYFYFDVPENQVVFHYMGQPQETRHILMKNYNAAVSPSWSIHSGSGTCNYGFIWGMAGENLEYTDMDVVQLNDLK